MQSGRYCYTNTGFATHLPTENASGICCITHRKCIRNYLTVSRALNRSTSPHSMDATAQLTGVSHSLTGTQPKYLSSQRGRDRCISQSHGHSTEVPLLSAWTRPVYLTVSRALNRSTSSLSVDATGVSHRLTGTQPKYLFSQHGCDRTANRCISQSHGHTTEVTLHSVWTRPVYPWALRCVLVKDVFK
jgi:hypothetical protein